jgi:hypothetical protein
LLTCGKVPRAHSAPLGSGRGNIFCHVLSLILHPHKI